MSTVTGLQPTRATLTGQLEEIWADLDTLLNPLTPADWQRKHGKHWVFADLPYHLSYYDLDTVATLIVKGRDVPASEQKMQRTMGELNRWNDGKFAERPASQSVAESMAQMRASRDAVRQAIAGLTEESMGNPASIPLVGCGWVTARIALQSCLVHTWAHFTEARLRLKQNAPIPNPTITHAGLSFFLSMMPMLVNAEQAKAPFTATLNIGGAGGGNWTVRVGNGTCTVSEEYAVSADMIMSHRDAETFLSTMRGMQNPMAAMLTGKIKVQGFYKMGVFGKLFAEPKPDRVLKPIFA
jgi:hypothetical protein